MKTFFALLGFVVFFNSDVVFSQPPRPSFKKGIIEIEGKKIKVEIARTNAERSYGLMYVQKMEENSGMLFIFEKEENLSFWMKNTLIPLSIGFFDRNQRLVNDQEMVPATEKFETYVSTHPALYALEMNKGWFKKNKIKLRSQFILTEQ